MHRNVHQGLYGEGFVYALVCAAGFTCSRMNVDIDGVDRQVASPGPRGTIRSPRIEVQVKSWSTPRGSADHWRFPLSAEHFNHLAGSGFQIPRYLVVVVVPATPESWAHSDDQRLALSHAAYWTSPREDDLVDPLATRSVTVDVPRRNLLGAASLAALVHGEREGAAA